MKVTLLSLFLILLIGNSVKSSPSVSGTVTSCSLSIFDTRVPWNELLPPEGNTRVMEEPIRHPDRGICGSYVGKSSCCSEKTLQEFAAWSDMVDYSMQVAKYFIWLIEKDPRLVVDQLILILRSELLEHQIDWKSVRNTYRDDAGTLLGEIWNSLYQPLTQLWIEVATYQEGLLCSACEPHFARFLDLEKNSLKLNLRSPSAIGDAVINVMTAYDIFMSDQQHLDQMIALGRSICIQIAGSAPCYLFNTIFNAALKYITEVSLRKLLCASNARNIPEANQHCKDFVVHRVLRGLYVDYFIIAENVFDYFKLICPEGIKAVDCSRIDTYKKKVMDLSFSFDERPVVLNVYTQDGFDIYGTACDSNLSGYACGGPGPRPPNHRGDTPSGNNTGTIVAIVLTIVFVTLGLVLFVSRHRIRNFTQYFYTRMTDDGGGPTVGLV